MTPTRYDPRAFPPVAVTVDLVVLTVRDDALQVLLVRRGEEPFTGRWALPGGFVRPDETLPAAAARELEEESAIALPHGRSHLEQLAAYGDPDRDPRMRVVSVAYLGLVPDLPVPAAGGDARDSAWARADAVPDLAFDHARILRDGLERARAKLEYTTLATAFCPPAFTIGELRRVYEIVWGVRLDPRNFHRKAAGSPGFLEPLEESTGRGGGRPARLYRAGPATDLSPPLMRGA